MSEEEFNKIFSFNLKKYMQEKGITQLELSKLLNVSAQSVSNWCNGKKTPRMDKVDAMCNVFGCLRSDLMENKASRPSYYLDPETAKVAQEIKDSKELSLLFDAARDAKPDDLKTVHTMLLALKRKEQGYDE